MTPSAHVLADQQGQAMTTKSPTTLNARYRKSRLHVCWRECPLWVISGHSGASKSCPLYPWKQTCWASTSMSA